MENGLQDVFVIRGSNQGIAKGEARLEMSSLCLTGIHLFDNFQAIVHEKLRRGG